MSNTVETKGKKAAKKEYPWYAVPTVLAIIMVSSGIFVLLLALSIQIFSSVPY